MTGMTSAVAVRDLGALAIETGQTRWTEMQEAAFGQLGIADAPEGDKGVFLHVSQRTGLDPFSKQIYMIPRWDYQAKKNKYTIQTGIEGFRVMRSRAERLEGVRGILSRPVYYDAEGAEHKVWVSRGVPVAVEMTYTVRDRNGVETPYTSILRFDEYRQTRKDGDQQVLSGQWATKPTHMLEKCTEADVYRKAFPQDFSGVQLDDAMPPPDPDAPAAAPPVQRVTAEQLRVRRPQTATATVVAPDAPPAGGEAAVAPSAAAPAPPASGAPSSPAPAATPSASAESPQPGAGEDPTTSGASSSAPAPDSGSQQKTDGPSPSTGSGSASTAKADPDAPASVTNPQITAIWTILTNVFGFTGKDKEQARLVCAHIVQHDLSSTTMLSKTEAGTILDTLGHWQYGAEQEHQEPRDYMLALIASQDPDAQDGATDAQ